MEYEDFERFFYTFAHLKRRLFKYAIYKYFFNVFFLFDGSL